MSVQMGEDHVAESGWPVAAVGGAAAVADGECGPHGCGVEAGLAADVEDFGGSAEHGGDDPGLACQAAGGSG